MIYWQAQQRVVSHFMQSEKSKIQKAIFCMLPFICHSVKSKTIALENRSAFARVKGGVKISVQRDSTSFGWWSCFVIVVVANTWVYAFFKLIEQYITPKGWILLFVNFKTILKTKRWWAVLFKYWVNLDFGFSVSSWWLAVLLRQQNSVFILFSRKEVCGYRKCWFLLDSPDGSDIL